MAIGHVQRLANIINASQEGGGVKSKFPEARCQLCHCQLRKRREYPIVDIGSRDIEGRASRDSKVALGLIRIANFFFRVEARGYTGTRSRLRADELAQHQQTQNRNEEVVTSGHSSSEPAKRTQPTSFPNAREDVESTAAFLKWKAQPETKVARGGVGSYVTIELFSSKVRERGFVLPSTNALKDIVFPPVRVTATTIVILTCLYMRGQKSMRFV